MTCHEFKTFGLIQSKKPIDNQINELASFQTKVEKSDSSYLIKLCEKNKLSANNLFQLLCDDKSSDIVNFFAPIYNSIFLTFKQVNS